MNPELVLEVLDKRKSLHIEDPAIYIHWEVLTRLLSESEEDTIKLLLETLAK